MAVISTAMTASIGIRDFRFYDLTIFYFIHFKLFCMSKMLKNFSVEPTMPKKP